MFSCLPFLLVVDSSENKMDGNNMENEVRCLNCLTRFPVELNSEEASCPDCKTRYRISWPRPDQPKIRGPAK